MTLRVRRGSQGAAWLSGCGVTQGCGVALGVRRGLAWFSGYGVALGCGVDLRVRRGLSQGSGASACYKAGPCSNPGSAPQRKPSTERKL